MELQDTERHSFVIRIWLEELDEDEQVVWRGHITHVFSGTRSYLKDLESITAFVEPYLREMGAKGGT